METPAPGTVSDPPPRNTGRPWALPLVLLMALAVTGSLLAAFRSEPLAPSGADNAAGPAAEGWSPPASTDQTVSLTIDFGNGERREFAALPWSEGMTVGDVLQAARKFRPGIAFVQKGHGEQAFLTSIDGVANDSAAGRFWLYKVDDKHADVSFEVQRINAGQHARWIYGSAEQGVP